MRNIFWKNGMALFENHALYERVESKQEIIVFVKATY